MIIFINRKKRFQKILSIFANASFLENETVGVNADINFASRSPPWAGKPRLRRFLNNRTKSVFKKGVVRGDCF